jgi:hypothetical protein
MPMRYSMRVGGRAPAFDPPMPAWISLAQNSAAAVLANSAKRLSPVVLTMQP